MTFFWTLVVLFWPLIAGIGGAYYWSNGVIVQNWGRVLKGFSLVLLCLLLYAFEVSFLATDYTYISWLLVSGVIVILIYMKYDDE